MQHNMKRIAFLSLFFLCAATLFAQDKEHQYKVAKNLDVFNTIYKNLDLMYVDTLNADEVVGTGIEAMLSSLDPYTEYYTKEKNDELNTTITGKYAGIGALIKFNNRIKNVVIDQPYAATPAAEAGLKKGDIILSIDNLSMAGKDNTFVSNHLRGDAGTSFVLKIKRPSTGKTMTFKITRRAIQLPAVPHFGMQPGDVGYIKLTSFTEGCAQDVRKAFTDLKAQGARSLVLDLRGNGGGSLAEAVAIVNMFVPKGITLVRTIGKIQRANSQYETTQEPIDTVMPIAVLVDGNSASASEITSGCLQDLDRAVIIGTRTFGKGLVQQVLNLPYGGLIKLTTGKYYIPSGRCIQAVNYRHAKGGTSENVPDSLTKVFHTVGGREVRDGGGIKPDIEVRPDSVPNIALYLAGLRDSNEVMHNYEVEYIAKHPTIVSPEKFQLTDADYALFKKRVVESGFKYDGETSKYLDNLIRLARFEGYYNNAKPLFDQLKQQLQHNIEHDLDYNKAFLANLLANEIVQAYYFQAGGIVHSLLQDKQFKRAAELLQNPDAYRAVLKK